MTVIRPLLAGAAVALLVFSVVGLATRDTPVATPSSPGEVLIVGFAFGPDALEVTAGSTVTWTNTDSTDHTVDSNGANVDSKTIGSDGTYEYTFDQAGTYAYFCAFHPFMVGTVEVTA